MRGDDDMRYLIAERIAHRLHSDAILSEKDRLWLRDLEFRTIYEHFEPTNFRRMDRIWALSKFAEAVAEIEGDTADCGVFEGLSSYVICRALAGTRRRHHVFDSFEGLSEPGTNDGSHWTEHALSAAQDVVQRNLAEFSFVDYHAGWIPDRFEDVADIQFALVHVDVDLYQPTRDTVAFFDRRMVEGGFMVLDDHGFAVCPGARQAALEVLRQRERTLIELPTGQAFVRY